MVKCSSDGNLPMTWTLRLRLVYTSDSIIFYLYIADYLVFVVIDTSFRIKTLFIGSLPSSSDQDDSCLCNALICFLGLQNFFLCQLWQSRFLDTYSNNSMGIAYLCCWYMSMSAHRIPQTSTSFYSDNAIQHNSISNVMRSFSFPYMS